MNYKITPLPWMLNYVIDGAFEVIANGTPYTKVICSRAKWTTNKDESEANAAYIVTACNAYPKLVEALVNTLNMYRPHASPFDSVANVTTNEAEAALLAAGVEL